MMNNTRELLKKVFQKDGWLESKGYRTTQEQEDYANFTLDSIECTGKFNLLEAGTGVGKSFGYLLPLAAYSVLSEKRVIIATHSIALQKALMSSAIPMVIECLSDFDFPEFTYEQRVGMQHFVDPERANSAVEPHIENQADQAKSFLTWAKNCATQGEGLIEDWIQNWGELPFELSFSDICITPYSTEGVNRAYDHHKDSGKGANIVFTSHMMLINAIGKNSLGDIDSGDVILIDEADAILDVAEEFGRHHLRLDHIARNIHKHASCLTKTGNDLLCEIQTTIESAKSRYTNLKDGYAPFESEEIFLDDFSKLNKILNLTSNLNKKIKLAKKDSFSASEIARISHEAKYTKDLLGGFSNLLSAYRTPVRNEFGYIISSALPSSILRYFTKRDVSIICTSATLSDRAHSRQEKQFKHFLSQIGLSENNGAGITCSIEPKSYGMAEYVISSPKTPSPFIKVDNELDYNNSWLQDTASAVKEALSNKGNILVLTSSYEEVRNFKKLLGDISAITFHTDGPLSEAFEKVEQNNQRCLFTPAGWSGFNFRTGTSQFFNKVIITKIPFTPTDTIGILTRAAFLSEGNVIKQHNIELARRYAHIQSTERVIKKLTQGMGRLIRSPTDSGEIWILDPRFPRFGEKKTKKDNLTNSVPCRFLPNYHNHKIIEQGFITTNNNAPTGAAMGFL